jgi:hypothetical protein
MRNKPIATKTFPALCLFVNTSSNKPIREIPRLKEAGDIHSARIFLKINIMHLSVDIMMMGVEL